VGRRDGLRHPSSPVVTVFGEGGDGLFRLLLLKSGERKKKLIIEVVVFFQIKNIHMED
jgi:hypothetical protein